MVEYKSEIVYYDDCIPYKIDKILNQYVKKGYRLHSSSIGYLGYATASKILLVFEREI